MLGHGLDRVDQVAVHVRVPEVEADADVRPSSSTSSTKCTSEPARDSSFGITSTATRTPSGSASRCSSSMLRRAAVRGCCRPGTLRLRPRQAQVRDQHPNGDAPRDVQRPLRFGHGPRARLGIGARERQRRTPAPAVKLSPIGA